MKTITKFSSIAFASPEHTWFAAAVRRLLLLVTLAILFPLLSVNAEEDKCYVTSSFHVDNNFYVMHFVNSCPFSVKVILHYNGSTRYVHIGPNGEGDITLGTTKPDPDEIDWTASRD